MGPAGFGGPDLEHNDYAASQVVIIPVPYDATVSYRTGSRDGPAAIISASANMELFDEEEDEEKAEKADKAKVKKKEKDEKASKAGKKSMQLQCS